MLIYNSILSIWRLQLLQHKAMHVLCANNQSIITSHFAAFYDMQVSGVYYYPDSPRVPLNDAIS